jgi:hypothetical protein
MYRQNKQSEGNKRFFKIVIANAPKIHFLPYRKQKKIILNYRAKPANIVKGNSRLFFVGIV